MKQDGKYRREFVRELMFAKHLPALGFMWFVTHDSRQRTIPSFAELDLLQAYYTEYGRLPPLNRCV